ncbi:MAG: lytic transglycosylase domain-containing protein, partial [Polyangiaceae bacterium]
GLRLGLATRRRPAIQPVAPTLPKNDAEDTQRRKPVRPRSVRPSGRVKGARAVPSWVYVAGGALAVLALAMVVAVTLAGRAPAGAPPSRAAASTGPPAIAAAAIPDTQTPGAPRGRPPVDLAELAETAHEQGPETPELRALIDAETRIAASCRDDPSRCARGWAKRSREVLDSPDAGRVAGLAVPTEGPPSAWLLRLKVPPESGVRDEPSLRGVFDYESKNISGRQQFQQKIFECAAYADIFESTFIKYGAPTWLTAVVFQESGCDPRAASPVGARGLWQFMPDAGRAYGLRVVEDDVDERLNPVKSTEAGVHFLTDLKRKLGSWDLAFAAYNMGPFGVATRIAQVGGHASFWDLAHAGLLPDETSAYVPAIEAHALILANLSRLQFSSDGKRLESTAEILAKPGTRLSLIARAAATSTLRIRQLNPEFLRDVVPDGEASARVPDAEAHRAQTFLEQRAADDDRDLCVPEDFDWGSKPFEGSKFAAACAHGQPAQH